MAYKITYGSAKLKDPFGKVHMRPIHFILAALICAMVLRLMGFGEAVTRALLPGDPEVTAAALDHFVLDLRGGGQIRTAFTDFCREIIENAQIY